MAKKAPVGRPPKYKSAQELQKKINEYFDKNIPVRKRVVANQTPLDIPVPTITGLTLYCGFADRYSFYEYEKKPEFTYTIKRARTRIEQHYEELLQGYAPTGAIFALKNFDWKDKTEHGFDDVTKQLLADALTKIDK